MVSSYTAYKFCQCYSELTDSAGHCHHQLQKRICLLSAIIKKWQIWQQTQNIFSFIKIGKFFPLRLLAFASPIFNQVWHATDLSHGHLWITSSKFCVGFVSPMQCLWASHKLMVQPGLHFRGRRARWLCGYSPIVTQVYYQCLLPLKILQMHGNGFVLVCLHCRIKYQWNGVLLKHLKATYFLTRVICKWLHYS